MSYQVQFFCAWSGQDLGGFVEAVTHDLQLSYPGTTIRKTDSGDGWVSTEIGHSELGIPISVIFRLRDQATSIELERASSEPESPDLTFCNSVVEVNLVGETDRGLFSTIWSVLVTEYSSIPYDEESGFTVSLE